jgi:hypothetical protein
LGLFYFIFYFLKRKFCLKKALNKLKLQSPKEIVVTYGAPVFAPGHCVIVLAAKIHTNSDEHTMNIRFPWMEHTN